MSNDNEEIIKLDRKMGKLQGLKNKITDISDEIMGIKLSIGLGKNRL